MRRTVKRFVRFGTVMLMMLAASAGLAGTLEEDFVQPPMQVRPHAWWHWSGNNVSAEGIVRDLRAMAESGVGGATIFHIRSAPKNACNPKMAYQNDEWWRLMRLAVDTAAGLGLELGVHNCPGFSDTGGPWITPELSMKKLVWTKGRKGDAKPLPQPACKMGFYRDIAVVTNGVDVYRFGYTTTGRRPVPAPDDVANRSLEADKLSAAAMTVHLKNVFGPLKAHLGDHLGKTFRHILLDSYEAQGQDWTERMPAEFARRKGYDLLPFLPALADAKDLPGGERFLRDFRAVINELFSENRTKLFHEWCKRYGMEMELEPYGDFPRMDWYEVAAHCDVPMIEFWGFRTHWMKESDFGGYPRSTGAVGRALGRKILATEAFTAMPYHDPWTVAPRDLKRSCDGSFARGINRMVLHHWVHQPFDPKWRPGMTMLAWGTHFGECQTWFEPGKAFFGYMGRCQALLQRGEMFVDILGVHDAPSEDASFDAVPVSTYLNALDILDDGSLRVRASGRTYPVFRWRPQENLYTNARVVERLQEFRRRGVRVWDCACDGTDPAAALKKFGIRPAFEVVGGTGGENVLCCPKREGDVRFFFLCNSSTPPPVRAEVALRATGLRPEYWYPEDGRRERGTVWRADGERTCVPLKLKPLESVFVVFRERAEAPASTDLAAALSDAAPQEATPVKGPWRVSFDGLGAPSARTMDALADWTASTDEALRYFSGTATYETTFDCAATGSVVLDLGEVRDIAEVSVNGRRVGVAWHVPFELDITPFVRPGRNTLSVRVTNGWHNRLAGDARLPNDVQPGGMFSVKHPTIKGRTICGGRGAATIPDFVLGKGTRTSGRLTFTTHDYFSGDAALKALRPSGLLGPVRLVMRKTGGVTNEVPVFAWRRDRFQIGAYHLNPSTIRTRDVIRDIKACGIDFIVGVPVSDTKAMECFRQEGVGVVPTGVVPGWWGGDGARAGTMKDVNPLPVYRRCVEGFVRPAAMTAIDIGDEPSALDFPHYGEVVKTLRALCPNVPLYLNLYPNYASVAKNNDRQTRNQLGTSTYREHIAEYCKHVPLPYISYDFYPYMSKTGVNDRFRLRMYDNFKIVADACRATQRDFWYIPQVNSFYPELHMTENTLRFQAYAAMAFGAVSITWGCYTPGWWTNNVLRADGTKNVEYDRLKTVNAELRTLAGPFMRYRNTATHFVGFPATEKLDTVGIEGLKQLDCGPFAGVKLADDTSLLVGEMTARMGEGAALFVLAADDMYDQKPTKHTLRFRAKSGRIRVFGGKGEIPVSTDAVGLSQLELVSNQALLITLTGSD